MGARWGDMRAAALAAEEAGFDGLWMWDHLRDPDAFDGPGVPEAMTVLTALVRPPFDAGEIRAVGRLLGSAAETA
jgi:alkanesulfonate monooxygenase SsuD/methylene tetrahydromethanopterin reductase-like flavin-dependent oxidoreductase (luciferase family)